MFETTKGQNKTHKNIYYIILVSCGEYCYIVFDIFAMHSR